MDAKTRNGLIAILAVFTALAVSYSFITRLKWGPDEPAHFIYIRSIATRFELPPISHVAIGTENSTATHEGHQPPLYYALMAIPFALLKALGASGDTIWRVLRLLGIPIGLAWLCAVFALCREFFGKTGHALAATAFVALIPTASYTFGVINNECLITLLFTWAMIPMLVFFKTGELPVRSAVILGVLIGLAILAKAQGLILLPMLLLAALLVSRRSGYANWRPVAARVALALAIAAGISGWWFARNLVVHGELLPRSLCAPLLPRGLVDVLAQPGTVAQAVVQFSGLTYGYFWTPFWLCDRFVTWSAYFRVVCALSVAMLAALLVSLRRDSEIDKRSLGFLLVAPVVAYLSWLRYALMVDWGTIMQGRLFLCAAAVVGITWVTAFAGITRKPWARAVALALGLAVLLAANAWVLACDVAFWPLIDQVR